MRSISGATVLLVFLSSTLAQSPRSISAAVSSSITIPLGPCKPHNRYKIKDTRSNVSVLISCNGLTQIPDKFKDRMMVNKSSGDVTLTNITWSDAGVYKLEHINPHGKKTNLEEIEVKVWDCVSITKLYRNDTETHKSLTMDCTGNPTTIDWTMDGEDLGDRGWLSDDNRTLTVPINTTGTFTVNVSNPVSADSKNITLINDLDGKSNPLGVIIYLNITKVIWDEGVGRPSNQTLILSRNVTNLYVLTPSDLARIKELSRNDTGTTISLTIVCDGEPDWTMDGEDLRHRGWLSDDHRTLTVPINTTGTFTVLVSNPVSADSKNITLINDLNGKSNPLGVIMYPNITKVIWDEGRDRPSNQTLILSRNVTNLYVLTPSEVTGLLQDRVRIVTIIILILSISLVAAIGLFVFWRNS